MKRSRGILFFLASVAVLVGAAIYNGFPLLYSDSGTYIFSGFKFEPPVDRPITYGLFIFVTSLGGVSPWLTIIAQSAILSWLLLQVIRIFLNREKAGVAHIIIITALCIFTGLSTVASQLIPDIFTPVMALSLFLFLLAVNSPGRVKWIYLLFFFLSCTMHASNILIAAGTILLFALAELRNRKNLSYRWKKFGLVLIVALTGSAFMLSSYSKSSHVFQMGRLAESGTLQEYLEDSCPGHQYALCDCIDSIPHNADDVIWQRNNRVLERSGGWKGSRVEMNEIIHNIYTTPHYLWMQIKSDARAFSEQLISFKSGEGLIDYDEHIPVRQALKAHFPSGVAHYLTSAQHRGSMDKPYIFNLVSMAIMAVSILVLFYFLVVGRKETELKKFLAFCILIYIINCLICSALVTVANRFGCRLAWLFPFIALLFIFSYYHNRESRS